MTEQVSGSSLPQAQDHVGHTHNHFHNVRSPHNSHAHQHNHIRSENSKRRAHKRTDSEPTVIVETVSVLQIIDGTGATLSVQTLPSATVAAPTVAESAADTTTAAVSTQSDTDDDDGAQSSTAPSLDPTVTPSESMSTSFPTYSYNSPVTSTHLSAPPTFHSLSSASNSTTTSFSSTLSSESVHSTSVSPLQSFTVENGTSFSIFGASSSAFSTDSISSTASLTSTSTSLSSSTGIGSATSSATSSAGGDFSGVGGGDASASPSSTAVAGDGSGSSNGDGGTSVATVAGSVLGAVAGVAFILILALAALRWKKRQNTLKLMRGSTYNRGPAGLLTDGNPGPGGGDNGIGGMSERRRSAPFAVPAALANLTGYKRFSKSTVSSDGGERGFAKVSGRKLPPVLQFGGDGYTDPRDTILSDQSIEYRDSQAWLGNPGGPARLALGSPMRASGGIPVFHPSPARTPITEPGLFSPYQDNSPLEPPRRDPLGRSPPSQDGSTRSHESGSKFLEGL
ncbi:hypothetical protein F5Y15DRAFT_329741 [Xylariaceae sp. FL0016]|nr:hypothetical protein F5Y15DRAFT_329741 [Xylariaceae sp. FL0016]